MASGISHILITQKVIEQCQHTKLKRYIGGHNRGLIYLGSVCPDLPYLSILDSSLLENEEFLAELFHYTHTDQLVNKGLDHIKNSSDSLEIKANQFALFIGFASHVIVDGIFHPFVRDKVGDYNDGNQTSHRVLEMEIDVLLNKKILGTELNSSGLQDFLTMYKSAKYYRRALQLFFELTKDTYSREAGYVEKRDQISVEKIEKWIKAFHMSLELAEGDLPLFYRKLMGKRGLAYRNMSDIEARKDEILNLRLPIDASYHGLTDNFLQKNRTINFFDDVYPRCLEQVNIFWEKAFSYVFENGERPEFPAINLDNGRLLTKSNLTEIPHYWSV